MFQVGRFAFWTGFGLWYKCDASHMRGFAGQWELGPLTGGTALGELDLLFIYHIWFSASNNSTGRAGMGLAHK